jgi:hypothetical protein
MLKISMKSELSMCITKREYGRRSATFAILYTYMLGNICICVNVELITNNMLN